VSTFGNYHIDFNRLGYELTTDRHPSFETDADADFDKISDKIGRPIL